MAIIREKRHSFVCISYNIPLLSHPSTSKNVQLRRYLKRLFNYETDDGVRFPEVNNNSLIELFTVGARRCTPFIAVSWYFKLLLSYTVCWFSIIFVDSKHGQNKRIDRKVFRMKRKSKDAENPLDCLRNNSILRIRHLSTILGALKYTC